jgi:hypothetical protein
VRRFLYTSDGQSTTGVGSGWAGRDGGVALRQGEWLPGMSETHLATSSKEALDSINKSHILNSRCVVVPSLFYRICSSIRQYYFWNIMHRSWFVRLSRSAAYSRVPGGMTAPGARGPWQYARRPMRARARTHTQTHTCAARRGCTWTSKMQLPLFFRRARLYRSYSASIHPFPCFLPPSTSAMPARPRITCVRVCAETKNKNKISEADRQWNALDPQKIPAIYATALDPILSWGILGSAGSTIRCPNPTLVNQPVDCTAQGWLERS